MRRRPSKSQRRRLLETNAHSCCVCRDYGVGLELHHVDGDSSNTVDENLAVLCVADHDRHHRPLNYIRHLELGAAEISKRKAEWEKFVRESRKAKPALICTVSGFGTYESVHSAKATYQWVDGTIVFERIYHLHDGGFDDWTTHIVEENCRFDGNIPLAVLDEPFDDVEHCPCCKKSLSNVLDRGFGLRLVAPNWDADSICSLYINPTRPSLALTISIAAHQVFTGSLHLCNGSMLHFESDDYEERTRLRPKPSVRTQATRIVEKLLRDWSPANLFIGTGDHDEPHLVDSLRLPRCWEMRSRSVGSYAD